MKHFPVCSLLNHQVLPQIQSIEVFSRFSIPQLRIIGLAGPEVTEARLRVQHALESSGFPLPQRSITVNLSPASVRKRGTGVDLGIALALRVEAERFGSLQKWLAWGELGLGGRVHGVGSITRAVYAACKSQCRGLIIAKEEFDDAHRALRLIQEGDPSLRIQIVGVEDFTQAWNGLRSSGEEANGRASFPSLPPEAPSLLEERTYEQSAALKRVPLLKLSPQLIRYLGVCLSGHHHCLLLGPRGSGKSKMLDWFEAFYPRPNALIRLMRILMSELDEGPIGSPVRRVGVDVRPAALMGSSRSGRPLPGEFSRSHGGILMADEFLEWASDSRESLRMPLEEGEVLISRVGGHHVFPAQFLFVATGNLCRCGRTDLGEGSLQCRCAEGSREQYLGRISGPILDRIDMGLLIRGGHWNEEEEAPLDFPIQIEMARQKMEEIFLKPCGLLQPHQLESWMEERKRWRLCLDQCGLSHRGRHKVLRMAFSLCFWDYASHPNPLEQFEESYLLEALSLRPERLLFEQE